MPHVAYVSVPFNSVSALPVKRHPVCSPFPPLSPLALLTPSTSLRRGHWQWPLVSSTLQRLSPSATAPARKTGRDSPRTAATFCPPRHRSGYLVVKISKWLRRLAVRTRTILLLAILTATDATAVDKFYRQAETLQVGTDVNVTEPSSYSLYCINPSHNRSARPHQSHRSHSPSLSPTSGPEIRGAANVSNRVPTD